MMDGWNSQFNNSPEGTLAPGALSQDRCRRMDKGSFVNLHSGVEMELGHCNFMRKGPLSEMPIAPMLSYEDPDNVTSERQFIESKINAMESLWPRECCHWGAPARGPTAKLVMILRLKLLAKLRST